MSLLLVFTKKEQCVTSLLPSLKTQDIKAMK